MNEETVEQLTHFRQFVTESHKLANATNESDADAKHELLIELMSHRFNTWTDEKLQQALANNDPNASYKITYARKELLRRHYRAIKNKAKAVHELENGSATSYDIATLDASERSQSDLNTAIKLLPQVFANKSTCEWVKSVLSVGKIETMHRYNQSHRQFSQKLNRVCRYATEHRQRIVGLLKSRDNEAELKELQQLTVFSDLIALPDCDDADIQAYITDNIQLVNDLIDTPAIKYQGTLVRDFAHVSDADKYTFANIMNSRKAKLESYLVLQ